jgi:hypothetical protein
MFAFFSTVLFAQPVLTFERQALKVGENNPMTFCTFSNAGVSGANVNWDFTQLKKLKDFKGTIDYSDQLDFASANTVLEEFGTRFYYNVNEKVIEHYGFRSASGKTRIVYDTPFEKIRFPFAYSNTSESNFAGNYYSNGDIIGTIEGVGYLEADAWGTISLPGAVYTNTLRVKSIKSYTLDFEDSSQEVEIITYRWYNSEHRYPLLVLIETQMGTGAKARVSTQAAYNSNAVKSATSNNILELNENVSIYPNPTYEDLNIRMNAQKSGELAVSILDISGKQVVAPILKTLTPGENTIFMERISSTLKEGVYLLKIETEDKQIIKEISVLGD